MKKIIILIIFTLFLSSCSDNHMYSDVAHEEEYYGEEYYEDEEYEDEILGSEYGPVDPNTEIEINYFSLLEPVESSCFSAVGYDYDGSTLVVEFLDSGSVYLYYDVPEWEYEELIYSESIGGYYNDEIKGYYASERIY